MASIRRNLKVEDNPNDSKNTRMNIAEAGVLGNWRADELTHISRYDKIVELMIKEARRLGEPLDLLEAGVGECWPLRVLYKAHVVKKSDVVSSYVGVDIDPACEEEQRWWPNGGGRLWDSAWFKQFNGSIVIQDLTTDPEFPVDDESIDFFYTTEVIEHMKREFVEPWIASAWKKLRPGGLVYVSTPNHDGSNDKLPEDHVYEWGFQELKDLLTKYFELESVVGTFIQIPNFKRAQKEFESGKREVGWNPRLLEILEERYGSHWKRVMLAAPYPDVSNNCAWILRKAD